MAVKTNTEVLVQVRSIHRGLTYRAIKLGGVNLAANFQEKLRHCRRIGANGKFNDKVKLLLEMLGATSLHIA